jgi:hypothetical protein
MTRYGTAITLIITIHSVCFIGAAFNHTRDIIENGILLQSGRPAFYHLFWASLAAFRFFSDLYLRHVGVGCVRSHVVGESNHLGGPGITTRQLRCPTSGPSNLKWIIFMGAMLARSMSTLTFRVNMAPVSSAIKEHWNRTLKCH